ncbi:MAG: hypothetical protein OES09_14155, partial [Gammaproteobacteria bacterium]|nr:hypothetical protein [Gammaproteobacteria bacterium]
NEILAEILSHLRGMWRYRWQVVILSWVVAVPGWLYVYTMPDVFQATAKVSVDTNSLLPTLTAGLTARENFASEVDIVYRALLTRPNLEEVARQTDLDLRADTPQQMEELITMLQSRLTVQGGRDRIFTISYKDQNRDKAGEVVGALLNTFIESSLGAQGEDSDMTERALRIEIDDHEQRLLSAEAALAEFKKRHLGYMPNDGADYYTRLQTATAKVASIESQMRLQRQRRDEIGRQLEGEEPVFGLMPSTPAQAAAGCTKAANILQLQGQLSQLQVDFTDKHPRIVMIKETIASLEAGCATERAEMGGVQPMVSTPGTAPLDLNPVYQNLRLQFSNAGVELASLEEEYRSAQRVIAQLRRDVDKIAVVETDLKKLNRDYNVISGRHQTLLGRWETLQSKRRLDPVSDLVQFNIIEPPFAAATPVAPNRPFFLIAVLLLALGVGGVVAYALNQLNPVFYTRDTLSRIAGLPVLGSVSMLLTPAEQSVRRRKTLAWAGANLAFLVVAAAAILLESRITSAVKGLLLGSGIL